MEEIMDLGDMHCDIYTSVMINASKITGLPYGFLNILSFIILGPLLTISSLIIILLNYINTEMFKIIIIIIGILGLSCVLPIFVLSTLNILYMLTNFPI